MLETGAICSILTSTSWIAALSPMMPVRCWSRRRSISRRAVATASSGAHRLHHRLGDAEPADPLGALGVGGLEQGEGGDLGVAGERGEVSARGSCTAPVRMTRSGFSRRTAPRASSSEENIAVEKPGRLERRVERHGGLQVVHGDEDLRGHRGNKLIS